MRILPRALSPLLFITPALVAQVPTVDQILVRHFEARGGLARIQALRTLTSTGRVELGPMALTLHIEYRRGAFRSDTSLHGMTRSEAFDGREGWILDPFAGSAKAVAMGPDQLKQAEREADFDGPLVDWRARGHRIAFAGTAPVNGAEAYVLNVTLKNGDLRSSFIDTKTYLEVKATSKAVSEGKVVDVETWLSDYRPVNGVLMPFAFDIRVKGQAQGMKLLLAKVEANLPVDEARFARPAAPAAGAGAQK